MPVQHYGVLRGVPDRGKRESERDSPHYQIRVVDGAQQRWRIPVNVKSTVHSPTDPTFSEVLYYVHDQFEHHQLASFLTRQRGFSELGREEGLDYIRGNFFEPASMRHLPHDGPAANDDLQDILSMWTQRAIQERAECFAFGAAWAPGGDRRPIDHEFDTDRGVHLIHMNQGSAGEFRSSNGVWQDGGLLYFFPSTGRWVALFLAFQSQAWHTDDQTGHPLPGGEQPRERPAEADVVIVAALVNPSGEELGNEAVTLLNTTDHEISLDGWSLVDRQNGRESLTNLSLAAGQAQRLALAGQGVRLSNKGGSLTLLDRDGLKVHGVDYTKQRVAEPGRTIVF